MSALVACGVMGEATARPMYGPGAGGVIPQSGTGGGGVWPTLLPQTPFVSTIIVPDSFTISQLVGVTLHGLTHSWVGDVHATLTSPGGMTITLFHRPGFTGGGFGSDGDFLFGDFTIQDVGAPMMPPSGNIPPGFYSQSPGMGPGAWPTPGTFSDFNGTNINGTWTLTIYDWGSGDVGDIVGWSFEALAGPPPVITEVVWSQAQSGMWGAAPNWDPAVVPNNMPGLEFAATIGVAGPAYTVGLDIPVTVTNLFLVSPNATLDLTGNELVVENDFEQRPGSVLRAILGGPGSITVHGDTRLIGATLDDIPAFISHGELIIANSLVDGDAPSTSDICDTDIEHDGKKARWTGIEIDGPGAGPDIIFDGISVFNNYEPSVFEIESNATMQQLYMPFFTATFNNFGTVRKQNSTGVSSMLNFVFNNHGLVEVKTGTLVINGTPLPSGALQTGAWTVRSEATLSFQGAQVSSIAGGAAVTLDGPNSLFPPIASLVAVEGSFSLEGGRDITLPLSAGALQNSGLVSCGPGSVLTLSGGLQCMAMATTRSIIAGATGADTHGSIACAAGASLGGDLTIELEGAFQPAWGDSWTILTYSAPTGDFGGFNPPALANPNHLWWRDRNPTNYRVGVRHIGDTDRDGDVDFADLNRVLSTFGQVGTGLMGDANGDGMVDFLDLNAVVTAFGQHA